MMGCVHVYHKPRLCLFSKATHNPVSFLIRPACVVSAPSNILLAATTGTPSLHATPTPF